MRDIRRGGVLVALCFDLIAFADFVRAELRDLRAKLAQRTTASLGPHRVRTAAGSAAS
jgi:hypothetical protein